MPGSARTDGKLPDRSCPGAQLDPEVGGDARPVLQSRPVPAPGSGLILNLVPRTILGLSFPYDMFRAHSLSSFGMCFRYLSTLLLAASSLAVQAQSVTASNPRSLVDALQSAGYRGELDADSSGDPLVRSASEGTNWAIYFYGCENNRNCSSVQFHAGFEVSDKLPLATANEWNRSWRFGSAYSDVNGNAHLQWDLNLDEGGISRALFLDTLELWNLAVGRFRDHIGR